MKKLENDENKKITKLIKMMNQKNYSNDDIKKLIIMSKSQRQRDDRIDRNDSK